MKQFIFTSILIILIDNALAQTIGNVGINTTTPKAMLHVKDSSVLFSGGATLPAIPGNPPASGTGARMMWYPDKAAFRAGFAVGASWDKDSIGNYSFASGGSRAIDYYSSAMGLSVARGNTSTAMGEFANASGRASTAMGAGTTASVDYATAMGYYTIASGYNATAMGHETNASGNYSTAMGFNTTASGSISTAMGEFANASSRASTAMGTGTAASGSISTAMGFYTIASGTASTTMGNNTKASGSYSAALGNLTKAQGVNSVTMGNETIAKGFTSTVIGNFNDSILLANETTITPTTPLFIVGNGNSGNDRSNALVVLKNGNIGINTSAPKSALHVIRNDSSGGPKNPNAIAILESNQSGYLQFSNTDATESGILAGNFSTSIRSAMLFRADSSIQLRAGGNSTKVFIEKTGNVGIGTQSPAALLDVNGPTIIGSNGTALTEIIKVTVSKNVAAVSANSSVTESFTVANSQPNSTVYVSPASSLSDGLLIAYARVSTAGTVEVKFTNTTAAIIDPATMNFFITVIR
jgi:hypothetical protein